MNLGACSALHKTVENGHLVMKMVTTFTFCPPRDLQKVDSYVALLY